MRGPALLFLWSFGSLRDNEEVFRVLYHHTPKFNVFFSVNTNPKFLSNCCSREEPSLPRKFVRSRPWPGTDKRRKLCNGHSQRVRVPVPERSRRRGYGGTGVDAGVDGHQPPRDTVFIDVDALPLSEQFASFYAEFPRKNRSRAHRRSR